MGNRSSSSRSGGSGFVGLLTILFVALKLTGVIDWNWLWVISPIWITIVVSLAVIIAVVLIGERLDRKDPLRRISRGRFS